MMGTEEEAGSDVIANSGPLGAAKKNTIFNLPDSHEEEAHAQVTIDVQSVNKTSDEEDNESTLLAESGKGLHISSSFGVTSTSVTRCRSTRIKDKLKHLTSFSKREPRPSLGHMDRTAVAQALKGLNFIGKADTGDAAGWLAVEKQFEAITRATASDEDARLPRSRFGECIGMTKESKTFAGQLFDALARKRGIKGDSITKTQLKDFWELISNQSFESRLQTFFAMVDKNGDGKITQEEIKEIISLSASANKLPNIQKQADEYAALIMEEFDPDENGYIMTNKLEMLLFEDPNQSTRGDSKYLSQMLSQKLKPTKGNPCKRCWEDTKYFLQDNWPRIWVMALWVGVMLGLFVYKFKQYRKTDAHKVMGDCVCMAKGAAETLKLNMALILLPVCRNTITWLRNKTKLGVAIPFDDNLNFHMAIAVGITVGTGIHGIYHLACDFPRLIHASKDKYKLMKPFFGEKQPSSYWHFVKGVEGVTGIIMVILMVIAFTLASPWLRRGKFKNLPKPLQKLIGFNAFWYSHHLFIIVYGLYIVHGVCLYLIKVWYKKTTWMYLAVPLMLYACERLIRAFRSSVEHVEIQTVAIYDGDVLTLQMSKPEGFDYQSGQYMFVNCAEVSPFEWHPFSITSAPKDDYLSVHIRIVGDWTGQLKNVFKKVCQQSTGGKSGLLRADCLKENNIPVCPRVKIDGPYGAPAQDYKKYEVILLVGLGIGATPMISIVKDIISNIKDEEEHEMNALEIGNGTRSSSRKSTDNDSFMTKKAYFYWVTREQGSFDWFRSVMNEVVESDHQRVIELHNYCTCVYEEGDARSAFIAMLQSLTHAKNGVDIVSGTRVKSHFSKPNWRSVYKRVALNHPHARVGVFYCGQPGLIKNLRQLALDFSHKSTTKFDFHKENF